MANEIEHFDAAGLTLYAKPSPIVESPWATDAVSLTESGTVAGLYIASIGSPNDEYVLFEQAGGSPAVSDTAIASVRDVTGSNLTQQNVADALKLAPTAGAPASGSVADELDTLLGRTAGGVDVTISYTVDAQNNFSAPIKRGDSYSSDGGNAFTISQSGWPAAGWQVGSTGTLKITQGETVVNPAGSVAVAHDGDETLTCTLTFTTAQTEALVGGVPTTYEVEVVNGSNQRTLYGNWGVVDSDES